VTDPREPLRVRTLGEAGRVATPSHGYDAIGKAATGGFRRRVLRDGALAMLGALLVCAIVGAGVAVGVLWGIETLR